jgi:hypothetical protein
MRTRTNSTDTAELIYKILLSELDTLRYDSRTGYTTEVDRVRAQEMTAQLQDALQLIREHFLE